MIKILIYIFSLLLLAFVALIVFCNTKEEKNTFLVKVDSLMVNNPDSALLLLKGQNMDNAEVAEKAKYALLLTQAEDKNYILHTSDSLINIAVCYYDSIQDTDLSAKSHYYLGRVYQDLQNEAAAVREFLVSLPFAEKSGNKDLLCLLYGNLGQIYYQQDMLNKADSLFVLSSDIAVQKNDSFNLSMALIARGNIRLQSKKYSAAMDYFERALVIAENIHNENAQRIVYNSIAAFYASIDSPQESFEYTKKGLVCAEDSLSSARLFLLQGNAFANLEKYDSAAFYVLKGMNTNDLDTKAAGYLLLTDIKEREGDVNKALYFQNYYIRCLDSLKLKGANTQTAILKGNRWIYWGKYHKLLNDYRYCTYGLLICVCLLIIYWINRRYRYCDKIRMLTNKKDALEREVELLSVMQDNLRKKEQEMKLLQEFAGNIEQDKARLYILTNQVLLLKKDNREYFLKLLGNSKSYKTLLLLLQKKKNNQRCKDVFLEKDWESLLQDINYFSNGFVDKLKAQASLLTNQDIRFCCLFKIELSYLEIALVFDRTLDAMYKRRNSILLKLPDIYNTHSLEDYLNSL